MIHRRRLLLSAVAGAAFSAAPRAFAAAGGESARLNALFGDFVSESFDLSPEGVTSIGFDNGARAYQKFLLGDRSPAAADKGNALNESQLARLNAIDVKALPPADRLNLVLIVGISLIL